MAVLTLFQSAIGLYVFWVTEPLLCCLLAARWSFSGCNTHSCIGEASHLTHRWYLSSKWSIMANFRMEFWLQYWWPTVKSTPLFTTSAHRLNQKHWLSIKSKDLIKSPICFLLAAVSSTPTPCLLTWRHVMLCQVLSPKKTRWTERSEKHAHKEMSTAFRPWLCLNQSQMQLQSKNTSD